MNFKSCIIIDQKITTKEDGTTYLQGYANTKGVPDSYGDIPMSLNGAPVYDLDTRFKDNPIILLNHDYDTSAIA